MKPTQLFLCALVFSHSASPAASISYAGFVENNTVNDWRTPGTPKPMDIDGDNIYGTHGAVHWTVVGANEFPAGSASPGWSYLGETGLGQFNNPGYAQVDNLANPAVNAGAGIGAVQSPGAFDFEMTGTAATYTGYRLRIGIMADVLSAGEWAADTGKTFRIVQTTGGSGDSGVVSLRAGGAGNGQPEMYFFDVTGVSPGDRFKIISGNGPGQPGYIGPVSWDLAPVPEPSSALLSGAGLLFVLRRKRRA